MCMPVSWLLLATPTDHRVRFQGTSRGFLTPRSFPPRQELSTDSATGALRVKPAEA